MKIGTWNVNGIRKRFTEVISWIDREEPDVVCLQETKASREQVPEPLCSIAGYHSHWHGGTKGYSGVALLLRAKTFGDAPEFVHPPFDLENRIVVAEVGDLVFGSVYVPNGGKDFDAKIRFLEAMIGHAGGLAAAGTPAVLCGDLNIAHRDIDVHPKERKEVIGQLPVERALFDRLLGAGLADVGRTLDPANEELFTWWPPWRKMRERNIGWRLDYVAASRALVDEHVHCVAYRDVGTSDHGPVIAHLRDTPAA